jgi:hypothetical protein
MQSYRSARFRASPLDRIHGVNTPYRARHQAGIL